MVTEAVNREAEVATEVTPEAEVVETSPAAEPTLAELQAKLAATEAAKSEAVRKLAEQQKAIAGTQRESQRLKNELQRQADMEARIREHIDDRFKTLAEYVLPGDETAPEPEPLSALQQFKARLRPPQDQVAPGTQTPPAPQLTPEQQEASQALVTMCEEVGITDVVNPPPELATVWRRVKSHLASGSFEDAKEVMREGLETYKGVKEKASLAQRRAEGGAKADALQGLTMETPRSSGVTGDREIFTESQIKDRAFWEKHREAILKAQEEGRIKA